MRFYCTEQTVPMHFYEALQVFSHLFGLPEFVTDADENKLITGDGREFPIDPAHAQDARFTDVSEKNLLKRYLYKVMSEALGYNSPWGCMTGVRPTKIFHSLLTAGKSVPEAEAYLKDFYFVTPQKIKLVSETFKNQEKFLKKDENVCSFYLGIPFCPTICSYCTFGSSPLARYVRRVDEYVDALIKEFDATLRAASGYRIDSVYIGGGTPTTLTAEQLSRLLAAVAGKIDVGSLSEFSLEAGRPDTITAEKLAVMKKYGVTRISINPQSMNVKTLERIGRSHSPKSTLDVYKTAKESGFDNINMDLICGLPGENTEDFTNTLDCVTKLSPECVTVHTLSLKRASDLSKNEEEIGAVAAWETEKMSAVAFDTLTACGYRPFYMYRQKNCVGNNENVCYCKPGYESPYNIHIMEEDMTIFACGEGAVTKIVKGDKISRFFNMKSVEDYFSRFDAQLEAKINFCGEA